MSVVMEGLLLGLLGLLDVGTQAGREGGYFQKS